MVVFGRTCDWNKIRCCCESGCVVYNALPDVMIQISPDNGVCADNNRLSDDLDTERSPSRVYSRNKFVNDV